MEPIVLEPKPDVTPAEIAAVLEQSGLQEGSEVFIKRLKALDENAWNAVLIIALVAVGFVAALKRKHEVDAEVDTIVKKAQDAEWSEELLKKMFEDGPDVEALERAIEERTGVTITVEAGGEWPTSGMYLLDRAYGDDEPDISGLSAREPNPDYRP